MPSLARVQAFVRAVREGRYVEAIEDFYVEDATMQENLGALRQGRDALIQHEKGVLGSLKSMATHDVGAVLIDGDRVVVNWVFEMTGQDGSVRRMDELALQTWRGDRIAEEQFYYDPGQMATVVS
jgi:ketosteroid isomerase-like protein